MGTGHAMVRLVLRVFGYTLAWAFTILLVFLLGFFAGLWPWP